MIRLIDVGKRYGKNVVFENFNLDIEDKKILAVLGASGCGKTTMLNILSDLTDYEGKTEGNGKRVSYMFQQHRLLPNLNVYKNLEYVLKNLPKQERDERIRDALTKVEMWDDRNKFVSELSGGMAQRAALARAFVYDAPLLLMDEPFKGLDVSLKKRIIGVFLKLYSQDTRTTVFVTHEIDDAFMIADRIIVLKKGGIIAEDIRLDKVAADRTIGDYADLKERVYNII